MAIKIRITRESGTVRFEKVVVPETENVFFVNFDTVAAHHPSLLPHPLGKAPPSPPSIEVVPHSPYSCLIHPDEEGEIEIVPVLNQTATDLEAATIGQSINEQQIIDGGKSPYQVSAAAFAIRDSSGALVQSGSGIGPGLQLTTDDTGIFVQGTPTVAGTYTFAFSVDDASSQNRQVQYQMVVS